MKFLVVGGGSMGKRRTRCLIANDVPKEDISLVDTREDRRDEVRKTLGVDVYGDIDAGLASDPDAVIVSVPGAYHMDVCLAAARAGKHFFCEVPLSISMDGIDELEALVSQKNLIAAPGVQLPFHPLLRQVKEWLRDPAFGKLLMVNQSFGEYLPGWHPYEDYRTFYASKQSMGGGDLDVVAYELASLYWLIEDRVERLACSGSHVSTLEVEGSDCWQMLGRTSGGVRVIQHFDMVQRATQGVSRYISESGTIELNFGDGYARRYLASTEKWEKVTSPDGFDYEDCFIEEVGAFIRCIEGDAIWHNSLETAVDIVRFLMAMQRSSESETWVEL